MTTATAEDPQQQRSLEAQLDHLAKSPKLLVTCDYDGTLAPIVDDPSRAHPLRECIVAMRMLAEQPETEVAVVSGRALGDLVKLTRLPETVHHVGSHGSEFDVGFIDSLTPKQAELRQTILHELRGISEAHEGTSLESKPASVALHYRGASEDVAKRVVKAIEAGPGAREGVQVKRGKMVFELAVVKTDKGTALQTIRQRVGATAVLFIGDDVTDEDAFKTLRGPDIGIKVGEGETAARFRVDDPHDVARLLARIAEQRTAWRCGGQAVPIDHHAMLSDLRTIALVTPGARITWLCAPRVDSPSLFAELLGGPTAGYFAIAPDSVTQKPHQKYDDDSLVLDTHFENFRVRDFFDCGGGRAFQRSGRSDLVRLVEGSGEARVEFAPRLDFGRNPTKLEVRDNGIEVLDSPEPIVLYAPDIDWEITANGLHDTATATVNLKKGEPVVLSLRIGSGSLRPPVIRAKDRASETRRFWSQWADQLTLPRLARDQVKRSALVLRGLIHGPSGAMAAAGTTSLPETIGGVRNWDYRYCWPRDSAIAATALAKLGSMSEGMSLLDWLLTVVERALGPDRLRPLYTVTGEELGAEAEIGDLAGYAGSRPVRIGNAAARQVQLDVFGPVVDLVHELAKRDAPLSPQHWRIVEAMVSAVRMRWHEPDHGIWEIRGVRRNHVHSRVMCWLTIDRAIRTANILRDKVPTEWLDLREAIAMDVNERGFNQDVGAFTASYEQTDLDAATLWTGLSGLVKPDDPRFIKTVEAVERELRSGPGVYRYRFDDNLPGVEGTFHLCTTWLILSYQLIGRSDDARALFYDYINLVGPTGLMSEEFSISSNLALGNHPQAYSHAGLIECAVALDE